MGYFFNFVSHHEPLGRAGLEIWSNKSFKPDEEGFCEAYLKQGGFPALVEKRGEKGGQLNN